MTLRSARTYAVLPVSAATFNEIKKKLEEAGYDHAFHHEAKVEFTGRGLYAAENSILTIDMHGIALQEEK